MLGFLFGEGTDTPSAQELARKRAIINQLMGRDLQPQTFASGVRQFGGALAGRFGDRRLDPKEDAERERVMAEFSANPIVAALMGGQPMSAPPMAFGGSAPVAPAQPAQPPVQGAPVPPVTTSPIPAAGPAGGPVPGAPAPLPPQIAAAVDRVDPQGGMAQGGSQGQFTEAGISSMGAPDASAFPSSLIETESGGNWGALNNVPGAGGHTGHGGRLQFGTARLQEAANAGVVPPMTAQEFARQPPEVQMAVENWHFSDIDNFIRQNGFDQLIGQEINGTPITIDGMRAVAHLGGKGGLARFIETRGGYNPADANGTSLANYFARHGNGGSFSPGGMTETMSSMGTSGPSGGNMAIVMQLAELMGNPYLPEGQRMVAQMLIQQQMGTMFPAQMSQMDQIELERAQLELEQMRNPQPDTPDAPTSVREYQFYVDQELAAGREPMTFQDFTVLEAEAGNPALVQRQQDARDTSSDTIINAANRALEAARSRLLPSAFSGASAINPASPSAEVYRQVESLRSIAAVENINAMRQQSPTGAALGAASDRDIELLKDKSGALDPRSPNFERDLADYTRTLLQTIHGYEEGDRIFRENYAGNADTEDDDGENTVLRWNPATNSFDQVQQ